MWLFIFEQIEPLCAFFGTRAFLHFDGVPLCFVPEGEKESVNHLFCMRIGPRLEGVVSPFFSGVRDLFQVMDVPVLVMCPCRCGATSPASQILEKEKKHDERVLAAREEPSLDIRMSTWGPVTLKSHMRRGFQSLSLFPAKAK